MQPCHLHGPGMTGGRIVISLFKAIFPAALMTWIVAKVAAMQGTRAGVLNVHWVIIGDRSTYWSWPMMGIALGLCWSITFMLDSLR